MSRLFEAIDSLKSFTLNEDGALLQWTEENGSYTASYNEIEFEITPNEDGFEISSSGWGGYSTSYASTIEDAKKKAEEELAKHLKGSSKKKPKSKLSDLPGDDGFFNWTVTSDNEEVRISEASKGHFIFTIYEDKTDGSIGLSMDQEGGIELPEYDQDNFKSVQEARKAAKELYNKMKDEDFRF